MTCPTCGRSTDSVRTIMKRGELIEGCDNCLSCNLSSSQNDSAKYNRDRQREDYRQDIIQQFEGRDYIRSRGIDRAREVGYSDEDIRRLY